VCVHKNVYAYISSKRVQQYVYIYTCVVLSALFLCVVRMICNLVREKKKRLSNCFLDGRREKRYFSATHKARGKDSTTSTHESRIFLRFSFPSIFFFFFSAKKGTKHSSHIILFFCLFSSRQNFFARVWLRQKKERERKAQPARAHANTHTHTHTHTRVFIIIIIIKDLLVKKRERISCACIASVL